MFSVVQLVGEFCHLSCHSPWRAHSPPGTADVVAHIHAVLTAQHFGIYRAGQAAYARWADDLSDDSAFRADNITPLLLNQFFCQADTETVVAEGRYWGSRFFSGLGNHRPDLSGVCRRAAKLPSQISETARQMTALRHGGDQTEAAPALLCSPQIRAGLISLIRQAQTLEGQAAMAVEHILSCL